MDDKREAMSLKEKRQRAIRILLPFRNSGCGDPTYGGEIMMDEIIELLQEPAPVKPRRKSCWVNGYYECGVCNMGIRPAEDNYCKRCGTEIDWSEVK